jgi:hypothetical protein
MSDRIITNRTITIKAAYKGMCPVDFGDLTLAVDYTYYSEGGSEVTWKLRWPISPSGLVPSLRDSNAVRMEITVEAEGVSFKKDTRAEAMGRDPRTSVFPDHITHLTREVPFTQTHRFASLEQFAEWAAHQSGEGGR